VADIIEGERVGVAIKSLESLDRRALAAGLKAVLLLAEDSSTRARCVAAAAKHFSLDEGVSEYRDIYERIGG
jgi:hypothetical protein